MYGWYGTQYIIMIWCHKHMIIYETLYWFAKKDLNYVIPDLPYRLHGCTS